MNELQEAVILYAKMGWHVFPLKTQSKLPAIQGGRGFQDATDDVARLEKWWVKNPTHNIGIATGASGLYVIDVDGERGEESLEALTDEHGQLPDTLIAKTGKGYHYFFKLPDGDPGNTASKLGLGIDTRGMGGYVVGAPSIHPDGHKYEWLNPGTAPAVLPDWVCQKFEKIAWIPPTYIPSAYSINVHPYVRSVWENTQGELQSAMKGTRNHALNTAAIKMGHWVGSNSIDRDRVEQELTAIARNLGLDDREIQQTLKSGIEAGMREPRYPPEPTPYAHENQHQQAARQVEGTITIARGSTFGRKEVKYLWNRRIPIGKLTVLAGPSGIGKSFISLALAANMTAGMPLLDHGTRVDGEVLFCSYEDDVEDSIGPRADLLGVDMDRCHFITGVDTEHGRRQFGPQDVPRIIDYLKACPEINLVVIDPLGSFLGSGTDGNSETEARAVLGTLVDAAAATETAILMVAHFNKGSDSPDPLHRIAGSQGITALPRSVLVVEWGGEDKERFVKHIKSSTCAEASTVGYRFEGGKFTWTRLVREPAESAKWLRDAIRDAGGGITLDTLNHRAGVFGISQEELDVAREIVKPTISPIAGGGWLWEI